MTICPRTIGDELVVGRYASSSIKTAVFLWIVPVEPTIALGNVDGVVEELYVIFSVQRVVCV